MMCIRQQNHKVTFEVISIYGGWGDVIWTLGSSHTEGMRFALRGVSCDLPHAISIASFPNFNLK